jgi:hypothetical protein
MQVAGMREQGYIKVDWNECKWQDCMQVSGMQVELKVRKGVPPQQPVD